MKGSLNTPKVFISYSWSTPQHEQWVIDFAQRLSGDGIIVILDKWDLKEGQDKHVFMEQMVQDSEIKKVLIICDSKYQAKANERQGGVGTESQLISKEIYESTEQEKFIPIIREYVDGKPCTPYFISSRKYIDLSSEDTFEENYQMLIRNLFDKPLHKRPPIGTPPAYIFEDEPILLRTSHKVVTIKSAILNEKRNINGLITDYLDTFIETLEEYRISGGSRRDFDESVLESIEKMLPLRNDFTDFINTVFKYLDSVEMDLFKGFLEELIKFSQRTPAINSYTDIDFDNYKFFTYEIILYLVAILIKLKRYQELAYIINARYFYRPDRYRDLTNQGIEFYNQYIKSLDDIRNKRLDLRRVSVTADLIKTRATHKEIGFDEIRQADLLLFYLTELKVPRFAWYPRTSAYGDWSHQIDLFDRLVSKHHFEKIKALFEVKEIDELKQYITDYKEKAKNLNRGYFSNFHYEIAPIETVFKVDKIGTIE